MLIILQNKELNLQLNISTVYFLLKQLKLKSNFI